MKKQYIYFGHPSALSNYREIYNAFRSSKLNDIFAIILPHENELSKEMFPSKTFLLKCRYMIADVSIPSIGLGIEMGWANGYNVPIIAVCKKGSVVSTALQEVTKLLIIYDNVSDLMTQLMNLFKDFDHKDGDLRLTYITQQHNDECIVDSVEDALIIIRSILKFKNAFIDTSETINIKAFRLDVYKSGRGWVTWYNDKRQHLQNILYNRF